MDTQTVLSNLMGILEKKLPGIELCIDIVDLEVWNGIKHYRFFANNDGVAAFGIRGIYPDKRSIPGQWLRTEEDILAFVAALEGTEFRAWLI